MLTMLLPAPPPVMPPLLVAHPVPGVPWQLQDYPPGPMKTNDEDEE